MTRGLAAAAATAAALAGCGGDGDSAYQGDPRCFAEDSGDASCRTDGVPYRVVDRGSVLRFGSTEARLLELRADGRRRVVVRLRLRDLRGGSARPDVSLVQAKGELYVGRPHGDAFWFEVPPQATERLDEHPTYVSLYEPPARCPGRRSQCFGYFRTWK